MKNTLHSKIYKKFQGSHKDLQFRDKLYGTTTLGTRGQLVIPAQARKDLHLQPGDQLVVIGKFGKVLGLMKTEQLSSFIDIIMKHVSGSGVEAEVKEHIKNLFGSIATKKNSNH